MIVLKSQVFNRSNQLALFVNENNIKREDILIITNVGAAHYTLFYYADSEKEEETHGFFS